MAILIWPCDARRAGLATATVRFSSVYGRTDDHADRVIPAFAQAAVQGRALRLEGRGHALDITHVDDVAEGLLRLIECLEQGERHLSALHLVSGHATELEWLALKCIALAGSKSTVQDGAPRTFDVCRFHGDPQKAQKLLGWRATTKLEHGLARLIKQFAASVQAEQR